MASQSEQFFINYAHSIAANDPNSMAEHHLLPTVFVTDNIKQVCNQLSAVEKINQRLLDGLNSKEVSISVPQINQAMRLSDSILFCTVKWQFLNQNEETCFSATCSYTLQSDKNGQLKIIVSVLDDDDKILCEFLGAN